MEKNKERDPLELIRISPSIPRCVRSYLKQKADKMGNRIGKQLDYQHVIVALVAEDDPELLNALENDAFYREMFQKLGLI